MMVTSRRTFALSALFAPALAARAAQPPPNGTDQAAGPCGPATAGTISWDDIRGRYADPDSRFIVLEGADGIDVHYKDGGRGPAVLLVHSSSGDLKDWDGWVKILTPRYRVVRLDLPAFGLTGPVPSGNYSVDRCLTLVDALMDSLGIERFAMPQLGSTASLASYCRIPRGSSTVGGEERPSGRETARRCLRRSIGPRRRPRRC